MLVAAIPVKGHASITLDAVTEVKVESACWWRDGSVLGGGALAPNASSDSAWVSAKAFAVAVSSCCWRGSPQGRCVWRVSKLSPVVGAVRLVVVAACVEVVESVGAVACVTDRSSPKHARFAAGVCVRLVCGCVASAGWV